VPLDDAQDALADAEGVLRVAEAKATDYSGDETKVTWQRVAAAEDV
jgi:fructose-specific component phosphotransferase system IIB-like protein